VRRDSCVARIGPALTQAILLRVATASEPASATWRVQHRTGDAGRPVEDVSGASRRNVSRILAPSVVLRVPQTLVIGFFGHSGRDRDGSPAGSALRFDVATRPATPSASANAGDFVGLGGRSSCTIGQLVALRPDPDGAGGSDPTDSKPKPPPSPAPPPPPPSSGGTVVLVNQTWTCRGPVDLALVNVTMNAGQDAIHLHEDCSGRIGRIEVDTWTEDGLKVNAPAAAAHELVIEGGYIRCRACTDARTRTASGPWAARGSRSGTSASTSSERRTRS
jgi:hypothetical protein